MIDIGGPTMVRAAAKNHDHVGIVVEPARYDEVLAELRAHGSLAHPTRRRLARAAFAHTAAYDAAIVAWFDADEADPTGRCAPRSLHLALDRAQDLRYGENPHQVGARYRFAGEQSWWDTAVQHGGKELSYLNLYDAEAAWRLVNELGDQTGRRGDQARQPVRRRRRRRHRHRLAAGPRVRLDLGVRWDRRRQPAGPHRVAEQLAPIFTEVVVAPGFDADALLRLLEKRNLRVPRPGRRASRASTCAPSTAGAGADAR